MDGLTFYLSRTWNDLYSWTTELLSYDISPLCDVAQTSDCGTLVFYFQYKPFMWCRSDVRLWHLSFIFNISPVCDVAQTPDCGMLVIYFWYKPFMWCRSDVRLWHALLFMFHYKPFMRCRLDARLRHLLFLLYPFEESFRHSIGLQHYIWISGGLPPDFPFTSHALLSHFLSALY